MPFATMARDGTAVMHFIIWKMERRERNLGPACSKEVTTPFLSLGLYKSQPHPGVLYSSTLRKPHSDILFNGLAFSYLVLAIS
jgi:hypothetical protein